MKKCKEREVMTRTVFHPFTIRIWWDAKRISFSDATDVARGFKSAIDMNAKKNWGVYDVEVLMQEALRNTLPITAYEILITATGNGIVGYIEWP